MSPSEVWRVTDMVAAAVVLVLLVVSFLEVEKDKIGQLQKKPGLLEVVERGGVPRCRCGLQIGVQAPKTSGIRLQVCNSLSAPSSGTGIS